MKRGDADACGCSATGETAVSLEKVSFAPKGVPIGGRVTMSFTLRSRSRNAGPAGRPGGPLREGEG